MLNLVFALLFASLALIEAKNSLLNAFVLFTIATTYFRGWRKKSKAYTATASILALCFASLSMLIMLAYAVNAAFFGEAFKFETGIVGFVTIPLLLKLKKSYQTP